MNKIKAAIIGCGKIAGGYRYEFPGGGFAVTHMDAYQTAPRILEVACCDANAGSLRRFSEYFNLKSIFSAPQDLLKKFQPDIVSICTPPETHEDLLELCILSGVRRIWCEKPIGLDPVRVQNILGLARKVGASVLVNFPRHFDPLIDAIRNVIRSGEFGKLNTVVFNFSRGFLANGGHAVDLLLYWLGPLRLDQVIHVRERLRDDARTDVSLSAEQYPDCAVYVLSNSGARTNFFEYDLHFDEARIRSRRNGMAAGLHRIVPNPHFGNACIFADEGEDMTSDFASAMHRMLDLLLNAALDHAWHPLNSLDSLENLKLCRTVYEKTKSQGNQNCTR